MMEAVPPDDKPLLLQAALDGELDAAGMLAFERAMNEDAELAAEYHRLDALRTALQGLPKSPASNAFRTRMEALTIGEPKPRRLWLSAERRSAALAAGLAFMLGSGLTFLLLPKAPPQPMQALVADHVRGLISGQPVDVASSDHHTVIPWFATRSAFAPHVVDLAAEGFPLVGGRIDMLGATPVPTLVYRYKRHIISLTEVPEKVATPPQGRRSVDGFAVLAWRQANVTYVAISNAMPIELDALAAAFRKATAAGL